MTKAELLELVMLKTNISKLDYDTNLFDAGLDSITMVNLIIEMEEITGIAFDSEEIGLKTFSTVNELYKIIHL